MITLNHVYVLFSGLMLGGCSSLYSAPKEARWESINYNRFEDREPDQDPVIPLDPAVRPCVNSTLGEPGCDES